MTDDDTKVIVRSNGTVGYVGKDIAYHLWKFGLLGRDFGYRKFYRYPNDHAVSGSPPERRRAGASALRRRAAPFTTSSTRARPMRRTPWSKRCARWATPSRPITTRISPTRWSRSRRAAPATSAIRCPKTRWARPYIEVSGRRGFGVKADDLIDALIASGAERSRHRAIPS